MQQALQRLGSQSGSRLSTGAYAAAAAGGAKLPVYWKGEVVTYLTLGSTGQPLPDAAAQRGWQASTLKVKR